MGERIPAYGAVSPTQAGWTSVRLASRGYIRPNSVAQAEVPEGHLDRDETLRSSAGTTGGQVTKYSYNLGAAGKWTC